MIVSLTGTLVTSTGSVAGLGPVTDTSSGVKVGALAVRCDTIHVPGVRWRSAAPGVVNAGEVMMPTVRTATSTAAGTASTTPSASTASDATRGGPGRRTFDGMTACWVGVMGQWRRGALWR